jgi:hypothetical protein
MPIINSSTYNDFVANTKIEFKKGYEYIQPVARQLYNVRQVGGGMGDIFRVEEIDGPGLASRFTEGADVPNGQINLGYSKNVQVYRIGESIVITWWLRHHGKYAEMMENVRKLGEAVAERMELDLTHRFTFATATSYSDKDGNTVSTTGGDGLAMLSTSHTVTGVSSTYRNRVAGNPQFSAGALEAAENIGNQQMIDNAGRRVFPRYDTIVTGSDVVQQHVIQKVINSLAPVDALNSNVMNPHRNKYKLLVLKFLDSTATSVYDSSKNKYWFLVDSSNTGLYCYVTENPHMTAPTPGGAGDNFFNENWTFKATSTYGIELLQPRGIIGSTGDGTA